jgi:hypothetical protein
MKTAIIFTGFFRTFEYTKQSLKEHIIDPLQPDIFFASPKTLFTLPKDETIDWHNRHPFHSANEKLVAPEIIDFFGDRLKSYQITDYDIEPYKKLIAKNSVKEQEYNGSLTFRIASQLHSKQQSIKLFKEYIEHNNLQYDIVILTRGDVKYFTPFDISALNMEKINYPLINRNQNGRHHQPVNLPLSDKINKQFCDQMLVGSQENMLVWSNLFDKSFDYYREGMYYTCENMMAYHLLKNNIDWCASNYIEYALWRNEHNQI